MVFLDCFGIAARKGFTPKSDHAGLEVSQQIPHLSSARQSPFLYVSFTPSPELPFPFVPVNSLVMCWRCVCTYRMNASIHHSIMSGRVVLHLPIISKLGDPKSETESAKAPMGSLPPGYRFYPTEEELVHFYLRKKMDGRSAGDLSRLMDRVIPTLDIYEFNPWDLPQFSGESCKGEDEQWFFFNPRQGSKARGGRPNRLTTSGYWKATGSPGYVYSSSNRIIGLKRTMVFYKGRAPSSDKTEWKMNEYKVLEGDDPSTTNSGIIPPLQSQGYSLCRVYKRSKTPCTFNRRPTADGGSLSYLSGQGLRVDLGSKESTIIQSDGHYRQFYLTTHNEHNKNHAQENRERTMLVDSSLPDGPSPSGEMRHRDRSAADSGDDYVAMLTTDHVHPLWDWINN